MPELALYAADGSIKGVVLLDAADYEVLSRWRWSLHPKGHASRTVEGRAGERKRHFKMHRQIMGVSDPRIEIDHINGNKLDNRRANLRCATHAENQQNRVGVNRDNKSGYRNVHRHKQTGKWRAQVELAGHRHQLGLFDELDDAVAAVAAFRAANLPFSQEALRANDR